MVEEMSDVQQAAHAYGSLLRQEGAIRPDESHADARQVDELTQQLLSRAPIDPLTAILLRDIPRSELLKIGANTRNEALRILPEQKRDEQLDEQEQKRRRIFEKYLLSIPNVHAYIDNIPYAASYLAHICIELYFPDEENSRPKNMLQLLNDSICLKKDYDDIQLEESTERIFLRRLQHAIEEFNESRKIQSTERSLKAEYAVRDIERLRIEKSWTDWLKLACKEISDDGKEEYEEGDIFAVLGHLSTLLKLHLGEDADEMDIFSLGRKLSGKFRNSDNGKISTEELLETIRDHFKIYKLNIGNPGAFNQLPSEQMIQAVRDRLAEFTGYGESLGQAEFREQIAKYYTVALGNKGVLLEQAISADQVFIGCGASEIIEMVLLSSLEGSDNAVTISPIYPLYPSIMNSIGKKLKSTPLRCENGKWKLDLEDFEAQIDVHTKCIILNSPNNPTGMIFDKKTTRKILEMAKKYNLFVISDEIYANDIYEDEEEFCSVGELAEKMKVPALLISGLSKGYGKASGFRIGWGVVFDSESRLTDLTNVAFQNLASARLCPPVPLQAAIGPLMKDFTKFEERKAQAKEGEEIETSDLETFTHLQELKGELDKRRKAAMDAFNTLNLTLSLPQGAYYGFFKIKGIESAEEEKAFAKYLLAKRRVHIVPGSGFEYPMPGYFRLVFLAPEKDIVRAGDIIDQAARDWREHHHFKYIDSETT